MDILLPTAYLPQVSYIAECIHAGRLVIEQFETYPKQTIRNHCHILGPNGKQKLSIPVNKITGHHTLTKDIRIDNNSPWQRLHWRSVGTAYSNSPFFLYYQDAFEETFTRRFDFLLDLNNRLLEIIFEILRIDKLVEMTDRFEKKPEELTDLRSFPLARSSTRQSILPPYTQVFSNRHGFHPDLSIIDLIFNLGPEAGDYLATI
ncbi:MAG: WbqC family protein [Bacteroidetes bacterium]|nr:WbqC family protein [Bacteroidota bacterium]